MEKDQIIYDKRKAMGESIRAMRTAQGWEQEQLAQLAGITTANVRSVEAGKYAVNIDVLNKIAGALGAELRMVENSESKDMETTTSNTRAGRPAMEDKTRRYVVADDVHEWILQHGGGQYITDTMRTIMAVQQDNK